MSETGTRGLPHVLTVEVQVSSKRRKVKESRAQEAEETKKVWATVAWLSLCRLHFLVLAQEIGTRALCWAALFRLLTEFRFIKAT